jgi:hypothetical protein
MDFAKKRKIIEIIREKKLERTVSFKRLIILEKQLNEIKK